MQQWCFVQHRIQITFSLSWGAFFLSASLFPSSWHSSSSQTIKGMDGRADRWMDVQVEAWGKTNRNTHQWTRLLLPRILSLIQQVEPSSVCVCVCVCVSMKMCIFCAHSFVKVWSFLTCSLFGEVYIVSFWKKQTKRNYHNYAVHVVIQPSGQIFSQVGCVAGST